MPPAHQPIQVNAQAVSMVLPSTATPSKTVFPMLIPAIKPVTALFAHWDMQSTFRELHKHALNVILHQAVADVMRMH